MAPLTLSALSLETSAMCPPTWYSEAIQTWGMTAPLFTSCVSSGKSHNLSEPHFFPIKCCCTDREVASACTQQCIGSVTKGVSSIVVGHNNSVEMTALSTIG